MRSRLVIEECAWETSQASTLFTHQIRAEAVSPLSRPIQAATRTRAGSKVMPPALAAVCFFVALVEDLSFLYWQKREPLTNLTLLS